MSEGALRLGKRMLPKDVYEKERKNGVGIGASQFRLGPRMFPHENEQQEKAGALKKEEGQEDTRLPIAALAGALAKANPVAVERLTAEEFASGSPRRGALRALLARAKRIDAKPELIKKLEAELAEPLSTNA